MSQVDEIVTPTDGKHVGAEEIGPFPSVEHCVGITHSPVIQADQSGDQKVRGFYFQSESIV